MADQAHQISLQNGAKTVVLEGSVLRIEATTEEGLRVIDMHTGKQIASIFANSCANSACFCQLIPRNDGFTELILGGIDISSRIRWQASVSISDSSTVAKIHLYYENRCLSINKHFEIDVELEQNAALMIDKRHVEFSSGFIRLQGANQMAPMQLDSFSFGVAGIELLPTAMHVSEYVAAELTEKTLKLLPFQDLGKCRILLGLADERTVETSCELVSQRVVEISVATLGAKVDKLALKSPDGKMLLSNESYSGTEHRKEFDTLVFDSAFQSLLDNRIEESERGFILATSDLQTRAASWFSLGLLAMRQRNWQLAEANFSESLLFNGANSLAWWLRNWCLRKQNIANESDLPNAHFLSPLEPCLRADSFFATNDAKLLEGFGNNHNHYLDVAEWLFYAGQWEELYALLNEAILRAPASIHHLLLAFAFLQIPNKEMATMEQITFATQCQNQVLPVRANELYAVKFLKQRFPQIEYLKGFAL